MAIGFCMLRFHKTVTDVILCVPDESDVLLSSNAAKSMYYPREQTNCPTIVWFHGGGLRRAKIYSSLRSLRFWRWWRFNYCLSPRAKNCRTRNMQQRQAGCFSTLKSMVATKNASLFLGIWPGYPTLMLA